MKKKSPLFVCLWLFTTSIMSLSVYANLPLQVIEKNSPSFSSVLNNIMPAVVNVTVIRDSYVTPASRKGRPRRAEQGMEQPPGLPATPDTSPDAFDSDDNVPAKRRVEEMGSGVIVKIAEEKGYIVTNAHVVQDAKLVTVTLGDGRRFKAQPVGADRLSDIAVLAITAKDLKALAFGDSDKLEVGDFVAAIGNPFDLHQTVTSGVVSALHRSDLGIEGYENFIQTDASINPGNSGGALVNLTGHLVGINTALIGPISGNVGIGLSIPSNMVKQITEQLIKYGKVDRGVLGIFVQDLTPALADAFNISGKKGALVTNVTPGSPAEKAGLQAQDVVARANEVDIASGAQLRNMMALLPAGSKVNLHVLRKDKAMDMAVSIANPATLKSATESLAAAFLQGVRLTSYDELVPNFGSIKGVGVLEVDEISDAWVGGLRAGDIILAANGETVSNLDELLHHVKGDAKRLLLKVGRGRGFAFLVINKL